MSSLGRVIPIFLMPAAGRQCRALPWAGPLSKVAPYLLACCRCLNPAASVAPPQRTAPDGRRCSAPCRGRAVAVRAGKPACLVALAGKGRSVRPAEAQCLARAATAGPGSPKRHSCSAPLSPFCRPVAPGSVSLRQRLPRDFHLRDEK